MLQARPDCIPKALNQVLATARLVTEDEWIHRKVLMRALSDLAAEKDLARSAPEILFTALNAAYKALGVRDPYENEKARANKAVQALAGNLREEIDAAGDPLACAIDIALAGAVLTAGTGDREKAKDLLRAARQAPPARDDLPALLHALARAESVLYLLNNAGEAVLDRLLIETLARQRRVTVVARHSPVLDDVTAEDARGLGFDALEGVTLIDPGGPMLGVSLEKTSKDFRSAFEAAGVVISKGQANYQTLAGAGREIFFLLAARNESVAAQLEVPSGAVALVRQEAAFAAEALSAKG